MSEETKHDSGSVKMTVQGLDLNFSSAKYKFITIIPGFGIISWILIIIVMIFIECEESWQIEIPVQTKILLKILHKDPMFMVVCVGIASLTFLGLFALYCYFMHCVMRENGRTNGMRRDVLLKLIELLEKLVVQEEKTNKKNETYIDIHYHSEDAPKATRQTSAPNSNGDNS